MRKSYVLINALGPIGLLAATIAGCTSDVVDVSDIGEDTASRFARARAARTALDRAHVTLETSGGVVELRHADPLNYRGDK